MKKFTALLAIIILACSFSNIALAHSHLSETNPEEGETVKTELKDITLYFDGKIMKGSYIELYNEANQQIDIVNLAIGDGFLKASLKEPLLNGSYDVNWSIMSSDGHPLEGQYTFHVEVENNGINDSSINEDSLNNEPLEVEEDSTVNDSNTFVLVIIAIAIVLLLLFGFIMLKRKKQ